MVGIIYKRCGMALTYQLGLAFAIFVLMTWRKWVDHGWTRLTVPMLIMRHDIHMTARFYDSMRNISWNGLSGLCV
jgi:hypothetical protein